MKEKTGIRAAETCAEVALEGSDGSFGRIPTMNVGSWHELEVNCLFCHEVLKNGGGFIVEALKFWTEACLDEDGDCPLVSCQDRFLASGRHRFCEYIITVVII